MFTANIGTIDRATRLVVGAIVIALGMMYSNWFGVAGVILVCTAFLRWCPAYLPFGFSTCAAESAAE